ncbi:MAG: hypothetical protein AAF483_29725 [Planctomycetota bacterium]
MPIVRLNSKFFASWRVALLFAAMFSITSCGADEPQPNLSPENQIRGQIQTLLKGDPEDKKLLLKAMNRVSWERTFAILREEGDRARKHPTQPASDDDVARAYLILSFANQVLRTQAATERRKEAEALNDAAFEALKESFEELVREAAENNH